MSAAMEPSTPLLRCSRRLAAKREAVLVQEEPEEVHQQVIPMKRQRKTKEKKEEPVLELVEEQEEQQQPEPRIARGLPERREKRVRFASESPVVIGEPELPDSAEVDEQEQEQQQPQEPRSSRRIAARREQSQPVLEKIEQQQEIPKKRNRKAKEVKKEDKEAPAAKKAKAAKTPETETEKKQEENPCSICLAPLEKGAVRLVSCDHHFHRACINAWLKAPNRRTCPMCRQTPSEMRMVKGGKKVPIPKPFLPEDPFSITVRRMDRELEFNINDVDGVRDQLVALLESADTADSIQRALLALRDYSNDLDELERLAAV